MFPGPGGENHTEATISQSSTEARNYDAVAARRGDKPRLRRVPDVGESLTDGLDQAPPDGERGRVGAVAQIETAVERPQAVLHP